MPLKNCVAIINYWCGGELLPYSVKQWGKCGIEVMIVYSNASNYRQVTNNSLFMTKPEFKDCIIVKCEPLDSLQPADNERRKRNYGLAKAKELGFTHFITCDVDELYEPFEIDWDLAGTVVGCQTYFKSPQLTIGLDTTLIPFVHKLTPRINHAFNTRYPFAFTDRKIRIDPTRQLNINEGVVFNDKIVCHHYSYVRMNMDRKIENSTARDNIRRSTVLNDLVYAKDGYFCEYYQKTLVRASVDFGIPEMP